MTNARIPTLIEKEPILPRHLPTLISSKTRTKKIEWCQARVHIEKKNSSFLCLSLLIVQEAAKSQLLKKEPVSLRERRHNGKEGHSLCEYSSSVLAVGSVSLPIGHRGKFQSEKLDFIGNLNRQEWRKGAQIEKKTRV